MNSDSCAKITPISVLMPLILIQRRKRNKTRCLNSSWGLMTPMLEQGVIYSWCILFPVLILLTIPFSKMKDKEKLQFLLNFIVVTLLFSTTLQKKFPPPKSYSPRSLQSYNQTSTFSRDKSSLFYYYCKRSGHLMEKCHSLHGYTTHFKFTNTKGNKVAIGAEVHASIFSPDEP